jgi:hypothetical protein
MEELEKLADSQSKPEADKIIPDTPTVAIENPPGQGWSQDCEMDDDGNLNYKPKEKED